MSGSNDPMELQIAAALDFAEIPYTRDVHAQKNVTLDFYLTELDVYVEVKQFHSERIARQMAQADNVIALQGRKAVAVFAKMLRVRK